MKIKLSYTRFAFVDEANNNYDVICPSAKRGDNEFRVYKNGQLIQKHNPQGGHVNKTAALYFLKKTIEKK